jgi:hypothetical protein
MTISRSSSVRRRPCSRARVLIANAGDRLSRSIKLSIAGSNRDSDKARRGFIGFSCWEARIGTGIGVGDADGVSHDGLWYRLWYRA